MPLMTGQSQIKLMSSNHKITKLYCENEAIYSAGNIVTYYANGVSYQEEVESGANCLNPTSFTPSKSGCTFLGWREDKTASGDVLTEKVMGDDPITLYAVFEVPKSVSKTGSCEGRHDYPYYNESSFTISGSWSDNAICTKSMSGVNDGSWHHDASSTITFTDTVAGKHELSGVLNVTKTSTVTFSMGTAKSITCTIRAYGEDTDDYNYIATGTCTLTVNWTEIEVG